MFSISLIFAFLLFLSSAYHGFNLQFDYDITLIIVWFSPVYSLKICWSVYALPSSMVSGTATSISVNLCFLHSASLLNLIWTSLDLYPGSKGNYRDKFFCFLYFKNHSPLFFLFQCLKTIVSIFCSLFLLFLGGEFPCH